jgi:hypothetical protein
LNQCRLILATGNRHGAASLGCTGNGILRIRDGAIKIGACAGSRVTLESGLHNFPAQALPCCTDTR